jgi:type I restriction enzyme S subunit
VNRIDDLIAELCSGGVQHITLGELGSFYGGLSGKAKEDFSGGTARFVTYMNVYLNTATNVEPHDYVVMRDGERQNQVHLGDVLFTTSSERSDECGMSSAVTAEPPEPLYLNSFCFAFRPKDPNVLHPGFSKHLFRSPGLRNQIARTANGVTRFNVSKGKFAAVQIPVPPLEIQLAIVEVLDKFSKLEAELEAELEARRHQHVHYRNSLFTFADKRGVRWTTLSDVAEIGTGSRNTIDGLSAGSYPFFVRSQEVRYMDSWDFDETAIITSGDGVGVGKIFHFVEGKYALHQRAYRIRVVASELNPRFLFHFMRNGFLPFILKNSVHSSVTSVRMPMLKKYPIPIPPLREQERIVAILDRFDSLVDSLSVGLPAELNARRQQYEYYRDKLLTFEEFAV